MQIKTFDAEGGQGMEYSIRCTSSLIDARTILLAGHCYRAPQPNVRNVFIYGYSDIRILSAQDYLKKMNNIVYVSKTTQHP